MTTITAIELEKLLSVNPGLTLLDVRSPAEFEGGHIEGSINIPLDQLNPADFLKDNQQLREDNFYLLCHIGQRAQYAAQLFDQEGFKSAVVVDGGISAWIKEGFKIIP